MEFESKKKECAVLIVRATSASEKWTIAGFSDAGEFRTVDPSHELSQELKKEPINKSRIVELAVSSLGRTLFKQSKTIDVGLSIATANDEIRKVFEPQAPSIRERLSTVESLHQQGIRTYVMIAPILPEAEPLVSILAGKVDYLIIDRMNYHYADKIYEQQGWREKNTDEYFHRIRSTIADDCVKRGVECRLAY
jgi:hypothetical protein